MNGNCNELIIGAEDLARIRAACQRRGERSHRPLVETQARVNRGSLLFIRGPAWHAGQLVLAVMVES